MIICIICIYILAILNISFLSSRPASLSLSNRGLYGNLHVDRARAKMASVESIGSCSLDFDASELSENCRAPHLTASEYTLQSSRIAPCVNGSHKLDDLSNKQQYEEKRFRTELFINNSEDSVWLTNGKSKTTKKECTIAEIKLPSYVSISCAINGYANYSHFCRSRDNSPARAFRKSSLEANFSYDPNSTEHTPDRLSTPRVRCSRSHSDCNGSDKSIFTESRQVTVSKQLQIPLRSSANYTTEIVINNRSKQRSQEHVNGHLSEEFSLAKEVGIGGTKSLVQQRIESLYGVPAQEKAKFPCRTSRNTSSSAASKRSPSCPPQVVKSQLDNKLPVFRHLTKNFRDQLLLDDAVMTKLKTGTTPKSGLKTRAVSSGGGDDEEIKSIKCSPVAEHSMNGAQMNGFHSLPSEVGMDECDRMAVSPPCPNVILNEVESTNGSMTGKGGRMFLDIMEAEKKKIQGHIEKWEEELNNNISEDALGKIRSACGKANLLLSQKFEQFRGLCFKNIEESQDTPFYTTASDLAGFWDMVMLQVKDIESTFEDIQNLKDNNWQEIKPAVTPVVKTRKSVGPVSKSNPCTPKRTAKSAGLAQAREEARKQLLAAKKRGRQQNSGGPDTDVSIFTRDAPS